MRLNLVYFQDKIKAKHALQEYLIWITYPGIVSNIQTSLLSLLKLFNSISIKIFVANFIVIIFIRA